MDRSRTFSAIISSSAHRGGARSQNRISSVIATTAISTLGTRNGLARRADDRIVDVHNFHSFSTVVRVEGTNRRRMTIRPLSSAIATGVEGLRDETRSDPTWRKKPPDSTITCAHTIATRHSQSSPRTRWIKCARSYFLSRVGVDRVGASAALKAFGRGRNPSRVGRAQWRQQFAGLPSSGLSPRYSTSVTVPQ